MPARMSTAEFHAAINREGGDLHKLFRCTRVDPETVPAEIAPLTARANDLMLALNECLEVITETVEYDTEEG